MPAALLRKPLPKPSPQTDPRYRRVMDQLKAGAHRTASHPPAKKKAADAAAAAKGPPNERLAAGKSKQVDKIKAAKESKPEPASFLSVLRAEVAKAMPKTIGDTEHFDDAAEGMKDGLKGNVAQQKEKSTQDISGNTKAAPTPTGEAKVETPLPKEPSPPSPLVPAAQGMPAPKSDADISLQDSKDNVDQQMKEAEVTTPQLKKANDPRFSAVIASKDEVAKNADAGPAKYRAAEGSALGRAAAGATSAAHLGAAAMLGVHHRSAAKVLTRQQQQKARDEAKRKEVVDKIESIYAATKARVETKLNDLDTEVNRLFDVGVDGAIATMTLYVNERIDAWKSDRYRWNPFAWAKDKLVGLPDEANVFYEEGRRVFQARMDRLIVLVADVVELRLKQAKAEVTKGKDEIETYVKSQPKELQHVAQQAQTDVNARFQELEGSIEEKKNSLAQSLAQKYKEGFDKSNEALKAIQEANKGLVTKFAEKLGEIIKALREFKQRVVAALKKSDDTISRIISDPIGFLGNLIDAVKGGISRFVDNIWVHLKAGFLEWLFGNLPPGVEIPTDVSIGSIFKLVLGVLGITYDRMRAKAVKLIGERNVKIIEKVVSYIKTLITGGIAALWEEVKTDLSNLKEMVFDALQDWLITTLIKKAVAKIVLLFNPVGAIIQAILGIIDIVMFVVENAKKILAFVESVINSIADIASGMIDNAIKKVEDALARTIPLLISFLARFLGLSGITEKIREFIFKVQDRVDKAIDKAIAKIVETMKKVLGGSAATDDEKQKKLDDALTAGQTAFDKFSGHPVGIAVLRPLLAAIRIRYGLTRLEPVQDGTVWSIEGEINPKGKRRTKAEIAAQNDAEAQNVAVGNDVRLVGSRQLAGKVTKVHTDEATKRKVRLEWQTTHKGSATRIELRVDDYKKKWRYQNPEERNIEEEELKEHNKENKWTDMNVARRVLNYRVHQNPKLQMNPSGKEWEHIHEKSRGGENSVKNLALIDAQINRDLGKDFGKPYRDYEVPGFLGTGDQSLRDFLRGASEETYRKWKFKFYDWKYHVKLKPEITNDIGRYQVID